MANSCVVFLLVVLFMHAYISCRLVYSWPFDEAHINEAGLVERVDKRAPLLLWELADTPWHSDSQRKFLAAYQALTWLLAFCLAAIVVVKVLKLWAIKEWLRSKVFGVRSEAVYREKHAMTYSGVQNIAGYCPSLHVREGGGRDVLLCCDVSEMLPRYLPETHCKYTHENTNLTDDVSDSSWQ
jgi:hypothetical protein